MTTRKLGLLGLMLGATLLSAACDDSTTPTPPPPAVTLNLVPDAATLNIGQTITLVAVIANTTNQAATFSSSNPAVATVNATTGLVTAVTAGVTVITATAAADANAKDASTITVNPPAPPPATPSISIKSVTTGNLLTPVNPSNVSGQIDVTLNVTVPTGAAVQRVETLLDGNVVCSQAFTSTGSITVDQDETNADEIVCPIPTNGFATATGIPTYLNGSHALTARLVQPNGNTISTPSFALIFNNVNFLNVVFSGARSANSAAGPRSVAPVGSQWLGGDITANITSVNYGTAANAVTSLTLNMTSSGLGVTGIAGCVVPVASSLSNSLADPTISITDGGAGGVNTPSCVPQTVSKSVTASSPLFTVVFPANALMSAGGLQNVEDIFNPAGIVITSATSGGGAGPTCINPTPVFNPQSAFCGSFFPNPVRVDNLAPRVTQLNILRPNQYYNAAFVPSHATGIANCAANVPCARTVDYGVDNQTASGNTKFFAGTSSTTLVDVTAGFTPLPETAVATTNLFQMVTQDALANSRTVYATTVNTTTSTSSTSASDQLFGIDNTVPTQAVTGPPNNSTNCPVAPSNPTTCAGQSTWTVAFSDAGVGPSGFNANPVTVKIERILSTGTTCYNDAGAVISCTTNGGVFADDGVINGMAAAGVDGYWRVTTFVTDAAGNVSTTSVILTLRDYLAPVAGGISSPASIAGGAAVSFSSALQDNVELGDVLGATVFGAAVMSLVDSRQSIGTYGPDAFTTTSPGTFNVAFFIKSIETTNGAGLPTGVVSPATAFEYAARDVAGVQINNDFADGCPAAGAADGTTTQNCILRNVNIAAAVALGSGTFPAYSALNTLNGANAAHGLFVHAAPSALTVCTDGSCAVTLPTPPNTTTLSATVTGPAATFNNPFSRGVFFYMQDAQGRWLPLSASAASVSATDNTVLNTRTWSYTFVWNPADNLPNGAVNIVAIGINASGSALVSQVQVVTLTNT